jgi:trimeric autotransporter adhesin
MEYAPNITPNVCDSNSLELTDTVRSFFANYNYYKWQRSTDGGVSWTDVTGVVGPVTPYWNGNEWEYVAQYTIPNTATYGINDGDIYRVLVATLSTNLADVNCRFADEDVITLNVLTCDPILTTKIISFTGSINECYAKLAWITATENEDLFFEIEKSLNGFIFSNIAHINSSGNGEIRTHYSFTDPTPIIEKVYYRLVVKNSRGTIFYSKIIIVAINSNLFTLLYVVNPFAGKIDFELSSPSAGTAITKGINHISYAGTENIMLGVYYFGVTVNGHTQRQRIIKIGD